MEQLNRIEIRGHVGNVNVVAVGDAKVAHFSVVTNFAYKSRNNEPVIETTWHNITAWSGKGMPDFRKIQKGSCVYVTGRVRVQKFNGVDGTEKQFFEVLANRVAIIDKEDTSMTVSSM